MRMPPEDEQYFLDLCLLFVQPGWHRFRAQFEEFHEALKDSALSLKTIEEFHFARGRADAFKQILAFEAFITDNKKAIDEAPEPDAPIEE